VKPISILALLTLSSSAQAPALPDPLAACQAELRTVKIERDVVMLEAQNIVEKVQQIQRQHEADKAEARQFLHTLTLYCPKVRG
jgi:hypothetical protein